MTRGYYYYYYYPFCMLYPNNTTRKRVSNPLRNSFARKPHNETTPDIPNPDHTAALNSTTCVYTVIFAKRWTLRADASKSLLGITPTLC